MATPVDTSVTAPQTPATTNAVPANTPAVPAVDPNTSLLQQYEGQPLSAQEQQLNHDWATLTPEFFTAKYGADVYNAMAQQSVAQEQNIADATIAENKDEWDSVGDATKNFIGGGLSAVTGTLAGITTPIRPVSKALAYLTEGIDNAMQSMASDAELASQRMYARKMAAIKRRLDREEAEDVAKGKSHTEASLARMGKEAMAALGAGIDTGHWSQVVGQGLGSTVASIALAGGVGGLAAKAGLGARLGATKAGQVLSKATPSWMGRAAPWSTSEMLMEGGGQYSQQLLKGLQTDFETLEKNSPEFRQLYKAYRDQGLDDVTAKEKAREDVSFSGARLAGALTAAATAPLAVLSSGIAKPFASQGRPVRSIIGDSLAEMGVSEPGQEASGQFFSNLATQRYLDTRQKLTEDVGQSAAEGFQGAMGMSGIHVGTAGTGAALGSTVRGVKKGFGWAKDKVQDKLGLGTNEEETEATPASGEGVTLSTAKSGDFTKDTNDVLLTGLHNAVDTNDNLSSIQKKDFKDKLQEIVGRHTIDDSDFEGLDDELKQKVQAASADQKDDTGKVVKTGSIGAQVNTLMEVVNNDQESDARKGQAAHALLRLAQKLTFSPEESKHLDDISSYFTDEEQKAKIQNYKNNLSSLSSAFQQEGMREQVRKAADTWLKAEGGVEKILSNSVNDINASFDPADRTVEKASTRRFFTGDTVDHAIKVSRSLNQDGTLNFTAHIGNNTATVTVPAGTSNADVYKELVKANKNFENRLQASDIPSAPKNIKGNLNGTVPRGRMSTVLFALNNSNDSGINKDNLDSVTNQLKQIASAPKGSNVSTRDKQLAGILYAKLDALREHMDTLDDEDKVGGIETVAKNIFTNKKEDPDDLTPRIKGKSFYEYSQDLEAAYSVGDLDAATKAMNAMVRLASHMVNKAKAHEQAFLQAMPSTKTKDKDGKEISKKVYKKLPVSEKEYKANFIGIKMNNGGPMTGATKFKHTAEGIKYTKTIVRQAAVAQRLIQNLNSLKSVMHTLEQGKSKDIPFYSKNANFDPVENNLLSVFTPYKTGDLFAKYLTEEVGISFKGKKEASNPIAEDDAEDSLVYADFSKYSKEQREEAFKTAFQNNGEATPSEETLQTRLEIAKWEFLRSFEDFSTSLGADKNIPQLLEKFSNNRQELIKHIEQKSPSLARYLSNVSDAQYTQIAELFSGKEFRSKFETALDKLVTQAINDKQYTKPTDAVQKERFLGLVGLDSSGKMLHGAVKDVLATACLQAIINASIRQTASDSEQVFENWHVNLSRYFKQKKDQYNALMYGTDVVNLVNDIIHNAEQYARIKYSNDVPGMFNKGVLGNLAYASVQAMADAGLVNLTTVELLNKKGAKFGNKDNPKRGMIWFNKSQKTFGDKAKALNAQGILDAIFARDLDNVIEVSFTEEFRKQYNAQPGNAQKLLSEPDLVTQAQDQTKKLYKVHTNQQLDPVQKRIRVNEAKKEYLPNWSTILHMFKGVARNADGTFFRDAEGHLDVTNLAAMYGIFLNDTDNVMLNETKQSQIVPIRDAIDQIINNIESSINLLVSEGMIPAGTTVNDVLNSEALQKEVSKTAVHFSMGFANTNRPQMLNGVNPMGNKIYREAFTNTAESYDLSGKTEKSRENIAYFKAALLQGIFGEKIQDYNSVEDAAAELDDCLTEEFLNTAAAYFNKTNPTIEDHRAFYNFLTQEMKIDPGDITPITYHNIRAAIDWWDAQKNGIDDLSSYSPNVQFNLAAVYLDIDGQCNGFANKLMYESVGRFDANFIRYCNSVGIAFGACRTAAEIRQDDAELVGGPSTKIKHQTPGTTTNRKHKTKVDAYTNGGADGVHSVAQHLDFLKKLAEGEGVAGGINTAEYEFFLSAYELILQPQLKNKDKNLILLDALLQERVALERSWLKKQIQAEKYNGQVHAISGRILSLFKDQVAKDFSEANKYYVQIGRLLKNDPDLASVKMTPYDPKTKHPWPWGTLRDKSIGEQDANAIAWYALKNDIPEDQLKNLILEYTNDYGRQLTIKKPYVKFAALLLQLTQPVPAKEKARLEALNNFNNHLKELDKNLDPSNYNLLDPEYRPTYLTRKLKKKKDTAKAKGKSGAKETQKETTEKKQKTAEWEFAKKHIELSFKNFEFSAKQEDNLQSNIANTIGKPLYEGYTRSSEPSREVTNYKVGISSMLAHIWQARYNYALKKIAKDENLVRIGGNPDGTLKADSKDPLTGHAKFGYTPDQIKRAKAFADKAVPLAKIGVGQDKMTISLFSHNGKAKQGGLKITPMGKGLSIQLGERSVSMPGVSFDPRSIFALGDTASFNNPVMLEEVFRHMLTIYDGSAGSPSRIRELSEFAAKTLNTMMLTPEMGTPFWLADVVQKTFDVLSNEDDGFMEDYIKDMEATLKKQEELQKNSQNSSEDASDQKIDDLMDLAKSLSTLRIVLDHSADPNVADVDFTPAEEIKEYIRRINPKQDNSLLKLVSDNLNELKLQRIARVRAIKRFGMSSEQFAGGHRPVFTIEDENGKTHDYTLSDLEKDPELAKYRQIPLPPSGENLNLFKHYLATPEEQANILNQYYDEELARLHGSKSEISVAARNQESIVLNSSTLTTLNRWFKSTSSGQTINDVRMYNIIKSLLTETPTHKAFLSGTKVTFWHDKQQMLDAIQKDNPGITPDLNAEGAYALGSDTIYILLRHGQEQSGFLTDRVKRILLHETIHAAISKALAAYSARSKDKVLQQTVQSLQISMAAFLDNAQKEILNGYNLSQSALTGLETIKNLVAAGKNLEALNEFAAYVLSDASLWNLIKHQSRKDIETSLKNLDPKTASAHLSVLDSLINSFKRIIAELARLIGINTAKMQWVAEFGLLDSKKSYNNAEVLLSSVKNLAEISRTIQLDPNTPRSILFSLDSSVAENGSSPASSEFVHRFVNQILPNINITPANTPGLNALNALNSEAMLVFGLSQDDLNAMNIAAATINAGKAFSTAQYNQINRIYQNARDNLKPDMFKSMGKEKLDTLFNPKFPADLKIPCFAAMAMASPEVQEALRKVPRTKYAKSTQGVTLDRLLLDTGNVLIDSLQRNLAGARGNNARAELNSVINFAVQNAVSMNQQKEQSAFMKALNKANDAIVSSVGKAMDVISPNTKGIRKAGHIAIQDMLNTSEKTPDWLRKLILDILPSDSRETPSEIYNQLGAAKTRIDQIRQRTLEIMPRGLKRLFKQPLTKEQDKAIYDTFLRTDLCSVYDYDTAIKYVKNSAARKERIQQLKATLNNTFELRACEQLADYLATGKQTPGMYFNAYSILHKSVNMGLQKFGKEVLRNGSPLNKHVKNMDELLSLMALDKVDNTEVINLSETETTGLKGIYTAQKQALDFEERRSLRDVSIKKYMNSIKGYSPMSQTTEVSLVYSWTDMSKQGYIQSKENKYIWYSPFGGNSKFNEGLVRHIHPSFRGAVLSNGSSQNGFGSLSYGKDGHFANLVAKEGITCRRVYGDYGVVAEEPVLPEALINKYIKPEYSATEQVSKYFGRTAEESEATEVSMGAIRTLAQAWLTASATDVRPREWVNLYELAKKNVLIAEALKILPKELKEYIKEQYGEENVFMVPRNQIDEIIGFRNFSVVDIFSGKTNISPNTQKYIVGTLQALMGPKAAYYLKNGEALIQRGVSLAKDNILVRSMTVLAGNIVGNFLECMSYGMGPVAIYKGARRIQGEVESYIRNLIDIQEWKAQQLGYAKGSKEYQYLQDKIDGSMSANAHSDIYELIEWGHLNTIEDMGVMSDDLKIFSGKLAEYHEQLMGNAPEMLQTIEKYGAITKNSALYLGLSKALLYGDFIAKQLLKEHLEAQGMSKEEIRNEIRDAFVDYNRSAGRVRQYLENSGLLWFGNYKLRTVRVVARLAKRNPLFLLLATVIPTIMGINNILTDNFVGNLFNGNLANAIGPGMFFHSFEMHPWL